MYFQMNVEKIPETFSVSISNAALEITAISYMNITKKPIEVKTIKF